MIPKYACHIFVLVTVMFLGLGSNAYASEAKVMIKVIDEESKPVEEAEIRMCLKGGCLKKEAIKGLTDNNGVYIISGTSPDGIVGGTVEKTGYYFTTFGNNFVISNFGMWQPWNKEIKVVLRPKIKPVPMYVRNKSIKIPAVNKKVGFDLIKFDWVAPYGLGIVSDFVIFLENLHKNFDDNWHSRLTITFSNEYDGIQTFEVDMGGDFGDGSWFKTPRYAPEHGYKDKYITTIDPSSGPRPYRTTDPFHFFRVRSEVDENGKLKRAMYGKFSGSLTPRPTRDGLGTIHLFYWLNPDYTRNMEFDIDRNLFSPLPIGEGARIP